MRTLQKALRAFPDGCEVFIRIEANNKLVLSGETDSLSPSNLGALKFNKAFLILLIPESKRFSVEDILKALKQAIIKSDALINDAGYELHSADLKCIQVVRSYLTDC